MTSKNFLFLIAGAIFAMLSFYSKNLPLLAIGIFSLTILIICANTYLCTAPKQTVFSFLFVGLILYLCEIIGANTGIVYGNFVYNETWKPAVLGTPMIMLFVWATLIVESYTLASSFFKSSFAKILMTSVFLVVLDLVIDPGAVHLGMWHWHTGGIWYGIPLSNYIGWFFLGILGALMLDALIKKNYFIHKTPLLVMYSYTVAFWTVYTFLHTMYWASAIGFVLILPILFLQRNTDQHRQRT